MPTPNQTTPDSPERVRASLRAQLLATRILKAGSDAEHARAGANEARADMVKFGKQIEDLVAVETTRLAEALKEAEAFIRECAEDDLDRISPGMKSKARALLTQPAPISGAKKE